MCPAIVGHDKIKAVGAFFAPFSTIFCEQKVNKLRGKARESEEDTIFAGK